MVALIYEGLHYVVLILILASRVQAPQYRSLWAGETGVQVIVTTYEHWVTPIYYIEERGAAHLVGVRISEARATRCRL